jgi:transposase
MLVHSISFLVKLNTHQVIDLLPERAVESAAAWMRSQSEIEYVSRARGNDYAQAAQEGAPQAASVADRFHFSKNLFEAIEPAVARCYKEIRKDLPKPIEPKLPSIKEWRPARDPAHQHHYQSRTLP